MSKFLQWKIFDRYPLVPLGAALSFGMVAALAGADNVTEDQILKALTPPRSR